MNITTDNLPKKQPENIEPGRKGIPIKPREPEINPLPPEYPAIKEPQPDIEKPVLPDIEKQTPPPDIEKPVEPGKENPAD